MGIRKTRKLILLTKQVLAGIISCFSYILLAIPRLLHLEGGVALEP
jgi:hypothetical protein